MPFFGGDWTQAFLCKETGMQVYEIRPRADRKGVDLINDALPFGRLWTPRCASAGADSDQSQTGKPRPDSTGAFVRLPWLAILHLFPCCLPSRSECRLIL